ncbi:MAG: hypothetical protein DMG99_20685 [Acidobacteria bacterium]|nr:MAG: hypothetical protein DMG99_20685 [Acidobacteriota bacterium]
MHESNLPKNPNSGDDGHASEAAEPGSINHATEIYGCAYAWALLPRVLLATPCRRWRLLDYYQVCLLCAAEYKHDWTTMRRTERVEHSKPDTTTVRRAHTREKRPSWVPRARRLKLDLPLRYRVNKTSTWYEGTIENISQSGVLFHGPQELPVNALVEMVFEMPEEISGQKNSNVVCQGRVMRFKEAQADATPALAASIVDYKFIH